MSLIKKALDLIQKFSIGSGKNHRQVITESKKKASLLDKATDYTTRRVTALPIEKLDIDDDEVISLDESIDEVVAFEKEPTTESFISKRSVPSSETFLSTQANVESIVEDIVNLDYESNQFLSYDKPTNKNFISNNFLGNHTTLEFNENGLSKESNLSEVELLSSNDNSEKEDDKKSELDKWENSLDEEKEDPFLSVEDSILQEISGQEEILLNPAKNEEKQEYSAINSKLENYLVIMEITKELVRANSLSEFFESLIYAIEGQIGAESIFVYSSHKGDFSELEMVAHDAQDSIDLDDDTILSTDDSIYEIIQNLRESVQTVKIEKENLTKEEVNLLNPPIEVLMPLHSETEFVGFILIGKNLSGMPYSNADFEFLNLLSEVAGNMVFKLSEMIRVNTELSELNESMKYKNSLTSLTDKIYSCKDFNSLYKFVLEFFEKEFEISNISLALHLAEEKNYYISHSSVLNDADRANIKIDESSKLIGLISQVSGYYKIDKTDSYPEIKNLLKKDETDSIVVFPLIHLGKLFGILFIHGSDSIEWTHQLKQILTSISNLIAPVITNITLQTERDFLFKHPFNPVDESISTEMLYSEDNNSKFTLIVLKIQNVTRILNLLGSEFFSEYTEFITSKLIDNLGNDDYISRVGQGKYAVFLRGKDKLQAEAFFNWIKSEFGKFPYPPKDFKLSIQLYSLTFPDQSNDKRKFIELIEDT